MKILHVVGGYPIGTHPFILWQVRGAIDLGHQVTVLAANQGNAAGLEMAAQLKLPPNLCTYASARTYPVLNANPRRLLPRIARAGDKARYGRVLAEQRKSFFCDLLSRSELRDIDLVQAHFVSWAIDVGIPLARLLKKPCVVTAHSAIDDTPTESLQYLQREADAVILVSDSELDAFAARTGSRDKLHRVWNGVPLPPSPARSNVAKPDRPLRLICAGRLDPAKRVLDIVEALPQLAAAGVDCALTIFGQGPQRDTIASRIHALGLSDSVQLAGAVPHAQLMDSFAAANLLVHASAMESFGMVMVEAMSAGLPVVAAASAGARDIVLHDATGLLFPVGDVTGLVASVRRLAQDVELRTTMSTAARQRVEAQFSLEAHMRNINAVWNAAVASGR
jgi:glycosyltransferase involved in cell wall biosynthesis